MTPDPKRPQDNKDTQQMAKSEKAVGKPLNRVDGPLKVTGRAVYAAEAKVPKVTHAVVVLSGVAAGKITDLDASAAEKAPGVLGVVSHKNAPKVDMPDSVKALVDPPTGKQIQPFQDDIIRYHGQPVAVVIAETPEQARHAASLVRATYREEKAVTDFKDAKPFPPKEQKGGDRPNKKPADYTRGEPEKGLKSAAVSVEQTYTHPDIYHNAMELHATVAAWDGPKLTLYDKTQWVKNVQRQLSAAFGMKEEDVHVVSPFVGGAFGAALRAWPHVYIAAMAARHVKRPVKLVLTRAQMYTVVGYRPHTSQKVALGATKEGKLTAIRHDATAQTSVYEEYTENTLGPTRMMYACDNAETHYRLAALNVVTPASMRGPGEVTGMYALECAMDELAVALKMDPVELRLRNHADKDPQSGQPFSSKSLKECYRQGAEKFGWAKRKPAPRSMSEGKQLIGWGMAGATWPSNRMGATVLVRLLADGTAVVRTAASDIGPGTYTAMTQVAADALGLPAEKVRFELGDSRMPNAPVEGGSMTMASVGSAVHEAALAARDKVLALASGDDGSPLKGAKPEQIAAGDGRLFLKDKPASGASYIDILKAHKKQVVEVLHETKAGEASKKFSMHAFGAHFVEVRVDADFGTVRVARVVSALSAGRIINPKTAHSQAIGGIVQGIGMALLEEAHRDRRNGRVVNDNYAEYLMPVHPDIPPLEAFYVDEVDEHASAIGVKGLAELSIVGVAAAIANAVYHATGKRVRDLPIVPEKLM